MRVAYGHHEALTFADYLDLESGKTLHAEPGQSYDIAPASGHVVPEVPEPWFTPADPEAWEREQAEREAARLEAEAAAGEPDGTGEPEPEQDNPEG